MKIKKVFITEAELNARLGGWSPSDAIDIGDVGGLIAGSIPFANATGFLTENNAAFFWDDTNELLKITSATALLIDLYPGFTGTGNVLGITPSAAIDTIDAVWEAVFIDGDALDPSAIGVDLHGIHVDFSTVDLTNNPHIDGIHVIAPAMLSGIHAFHSDGEIHVDIDAAGGVAGETYTALNVIIATIGSTGGDLHALDVARSGNGSLSIAAIGTHEEIDVIHQDIGTFAAADKIWEYDNDGPGWTDVTAGVGSIWDDKDDLLYVGHASTFSEIKFMFTVVATKDMHFKFYFSEGGAVWTQFFPADDTEGATQNGSVKYTASSLAAWAVETVNGTANKYWIQIERTRTSGTGPTTSVMQQLAPTLYGWDKLGAITALTLSAGNITDTGVTATNLAAGTIGERPAGTVGDIRFNSTLGNFEMYTGAWENVGVGDVTATAVLADHTLIRGDGGARGIQDSGIDIDDNDNVTLPDGAALNLQEDITFLGATTENQIKFPDNLPDALSFLEGANPYMTFITTNGSEVISFGHDISIGTTDALTSIYVKKSSTGGSGGTYPAMRIINTNTDITGGNYSIAGSEWVSENDVNGVFMSLLALSSAGAEYGQIGTLTAHDVIFKANGGERLRLLSDGKVKLASIATTDAGDYDLRYDATDGIVYDTSDMRQKENVVPLAYGLDTILQLQPRSYTYYVGLAGVKEDKKTKITKKKKIEITDKSKDSFGLIAQEVYDIIPEAVYKPKDEKTAFWGLRYKKLIPILINAVKELNTKIEGLEARLNN